MEYIFGNATGTLHNIQRSTDMANQLSRIGINDTPQWRSYITNVLYDIYYEVEPLIQTNGRQLRDGLLNGPNGVVKIQTIWEGAKLITIEIFGKPDAWKSIIG